MARARTTYRGGSALVFDQLPSRLADVSPSAFVTSRSRSSERAHVPVNPTAGT